jgi:Tfp pilus assembly protein PilF
MRASSVALAAALTLVSLSSSLRGQRPDDQIDPRSAALLERARAAEAGGNLSGATDLLETAVAVDPRNRAAFREMAGVADRSGLPGKAIRFYREALALEPNDLDAIAGRGAALVQKGAVNRARDDLAKLRSLCKGACPQAKELAAAIAKGPPVATAQVTTKVPSVPAKD